MIRILLFLVLFCCCGTVLQARQYTTADKLPGNTVYYCFRDSKGFLWFGTDVGAVRFDGRTFKTYTLLDGLGDNEVFKFYEDRHGRVWILTYNGIPCFFKNDSLYHPGNSPLLRKISALHGGMINVLHETDDSTLYLGYKFGTIVRIRGQQTELLFRTDDTLTERSSYLDRIYTRGDSLLVDYRRLTRHVQEKSVRDISFNNTPTNHFHQEDLDFRSDSSGMYVLRNRTLLAHYTDTRLKMANLIQVYCQDGNLVFCATRKGLLIIDLGAKSIREYFPEQVISCVSQDIYGNYWITTIGNGVHCLNESFFRMRLLYDQKGRIFNSMNRQVFFSRQDTLEGYSGTHAHSFRFPGKFDYHLRPLYCNDHLWICSNSTGEASIWERGTEKAIFRAPDAYQKYVFEGPADHLVFFLYVKTRIMLYTAISGKEGLRWKDSVLFPSKPLARYDKKGEKLYLAFPDKIVSYDPLSTETVLVDSFPPRQVIDLFFIGHKLLTPVHDGSFFIYDLQHPAPPEKTRLDMTIYGAWNLPDGRCIVKSSKGFLLSLPQKPGELLPRFQSIEYPFTNAEINDIYPVNDSILCNVDGQLHLFHQSLLNNKLHRPPLMLQKIMVDGKEYKTRNIRISNRSRCNLRLILGTFHYNHSDHYYTYRIRNEADTSSWYEVSDGNTVDLLLNRYGTCNIEIKAVSRNGIASESQQVNVLLVPPFYYDTWFHILILLLLAALVLGIVWWYNKRRQQRFEQELNYLHLEYKSVNSLLNPHFIFNAINNIQSLVNGQEGPKANEYLHLLSKLIRQNIENLQFTLIPLEKELNLVESYIYLQNLRFNNNIRFRIENNLSGTNSIHIPPLLIHTFIENAIIHGYRTDIPGFTITLELHLSTDDYLIIVVKDNGKGYSPAAQNSDHLRDKTSMGIASIRKRLQRLSGFYRLQYSLEITDLQERGERGTMVTLTLYARLATLIREQPEGTDTRIL